MLNKIDSIYGNGFVICDVEIHRVINIYGQKEQTQNGYYPNVSVNEITSLDGSSSSFWLMCKHKQMKATNFNDVVSVKKIFAGMYCDRENKIEYIPADDLYRVSFVTHTIGECGGQTKEAVILYLNVAQVENKKMNLKATPKVHNEETEEEEESNEAIEDASLEGLDYDF